MSSARASVVKVEARDTVTSAPEIVRMTLNLAMTHTDAGRGVYKQPTGIRGAHHLAGGSPALKGAAVACDGALLVQM